MSLNHAQTARSHAEVVIRLVETTDLDAARTVRRLAQLDSAALPRSGPALIAERDGRAIAAHLLREGTVVADPFEPTAHALTLLEERAEQLRMADTERRGGRGLRVRVGRVVRWGVRAATTR